MQYKKVAYLSLTLALAWLSPSANAQQLMKRMKCADFFIIAPVTHANNSTDTKQITVQIVKDTCRPRLPDGTFVVQKTGPGPGTGNYFIRNRYKGYSESVTLPFAPGDVVRVLFSRPIDSRATGFFDYTYTIH